MVYKPGFKRASAAYGGVPTAQAYGQVSNIKTPEPEPYYDNDTAPDWLDEQYQQNYPNLAANFDGERVRVSNNGEIIGDYNAQSGGRGYQYKTATSIPNNGPIPEGEWLLKYDDLETLGGEYNPKFHNSWGRQRVRISPVDVNTYGRNNFYLHGSYNGLGSAGCIDLGLQMPHFGGIMNKYKQDIPLTVKYKEDFNRYKK